MSRVLYKGKWDGIWDRPKYQEMRQKITDSFKGLTFVEEGHRYFLGDKEFTCVSNVTHMFQEHFDAHTKARETYERVLRDYPDCQVIESVKASIKYLGWTPDEIFADIAMSQFEEELPPVPADTASK